MSTKMKRKKEKPGKTRWQMQVYYLDSCNCDWGCPCQFNARPTHGNCEGIGGIHIISGNYGKVKLDRQNMAFIGSWPGPIHEGGGRASFYIDERASDEQFDALAKIITGEAGGGPFEVYRSVMDSFQEPRRAKIVFESRGLNSRIKIGDLAESWLEPIRNPVTGKVHRAVIELPSGFEASRMDQSSTRTVVSADGYLDFRYAGTYGSFQKTRWKGP
ncbi:MAG TPA: DUF1326 domain-containing protein [Nitrososphaera sp.]|nr:DUF1326 domain-containing protein [Nitrososphaera sp.]